MPSPLMHAMLVIAAFGAAVVLAALLLDRPWRFRTAVLGGALCATPALVAALYAVLGATVRVWDDHPETARVASIVLVVLLALASIGAHATRTGSEPRLDEGPEDGGGGAEGGGRTRRRPGHRHRRVRWCRKLPGASSTACAATGNACRPGAADAVRGPVAVERDAGAGGAGVEARRPWTAAAGSTTRPPCRTTPLLT